MPLEITKAHAKSTRIRRIQCENGMFLEVLCDGTVQGVRHKKTDYGVFHLYSVGPNMVVIRNIFTGLYLSVEECKVSTSELFGSECIFLEILSECYYVYYSPWIEDQSKSLLLLLESSGRSGLKCFPDGVSSWNFDGTLFKTLTLPEDEHVHFHVLARSLDP